MVAEHLYDFSKVKPLNLTTSYEGSPVVAGYLEYLKAEDPVGDLPGGRSSSGSEPPPARGRKTQRPGGETPSKKENSDKNQKNTLSRNTWIELDDYVDQVRPASKKESERSFLRRLLNEYSAHDAALATNYVWRFGVLGSGGECHSPLRYLSAAIEQVLPKARQNERFLKPSKPQDEGAAGELAEPVKDKIRRSAVRVFEAEVPEADRERLLSETKEENSVNGFSPPLTVLRTMAAMRWYEQRVMAQ